MSTVQFLRMIVQSQFLLYYLQMVYCFEYFLCARKTGAEEKTNEMFSRNKLNKTEEL